MSPLEHAKLEMDIAGIYSPEGDGIDDWARKAKFEPLCPLTGVDEEWCATGCFPEGGEDELFQNKRCSHVFKNGVDGKPYDIDGRVFVAQDGVGFTSYNSECPEMSSRVYIEFPYTPKTEYVNVFYDYDNDDVDFVILEDQ